MAEKDYYATLGTSRDATPEDIKKAFRKKAHQLHPDKAGGDEARFKELNEAYQVLSDPEKRQRYDQFGAAGAEAGPGQAGFGGFSQNMPGGFDMSDLFETMFSGQSAASTRPRGGEDLSIHIDISFEESFQGIERVIELDKLAACETCEGSGGQPGTSTKECDTCNGRGQVRVQRRMLFGTFAQASVCPACDGGGQIPERKCLTCQGEGRMRRRVRAKIGVPAGIQNGQTIEITGGGVAGRRNTPAGRLYVEVGVLPHPLFTREGNDIRFRLPISFVQAALGGASEIDTLDGKLHLDIPAGTQMNEILRVEGRGFPALGNTMRGDLLVDVQLVTPKKLTRRERELFSELQEEGGQATHPPKGGFFRGLFS